VSQPLLGSASQFACPESQNTPQMPCSHCSPIAQAFPHMPQFFGSNRTCDSQPFASLPSQFWYFAVHGPSLHVAETQVGLAFGNAQAWPHAPQFCESDT